MELTEEKKKEIALVITKLLSYTTIEELEFINELTNKLEEKFNASEE